MQDDDRLYEDVRYTIDDLSTAILVGVFFSKEEKTLCEEHLDELEDLANTYGFITKEKMPCSLKKYDAGTYIGKGKIEEIAGTCETSDIDVVIFDDEITPNQQKNLEKLIKRPVIDRTELILEVFAKRAQTKEARLQIELAKIRYQLPRLKRLWTHLSRQRVSGKGYLKGEGEKQIEIDRRILRRRLSALQREIDEVRSQRNVQRAARVRSKEPTFAIVGYTNVGKSTLLNALTNANILEEDKLFATLDTTTRKYVLPNHQKILFTDTVGFIRKLPHTLVAAFKSTLEEVKYDDILLHIIDASHPHAMDQAKETLNVLQELEAIDKPMITILNKIDKMEKPHELMRFRLAFPKTVAISAKTRQGFDELFQMISDELKNLRSLMHLKIPQSRYDLVSLLQDEGHILEIDYEGNEIILKAQIPNQIKHRLLPFETL